MRWALSWKADPVACAIADRHYSRKTVGAPQFLPPGRSIALLTPDSTAELGAVWATVWPDPELVQHGLGDAWLCTIFRNELPDRYLSSELVLDAVAATRWRWRIPPPSGMITFVDEDAVASPNPGYCFRRAGFDRLPVRTKDRGLVVLRLPLERIPAPAEPLPRRGALFAA